MIVLYDRRAIHELLDKRGTIYSERPVDHVVSVVTNGDNLAFMDSTPLWRNQRKIASHALAVRFVVIYCHGLDQLLNKTATHVGRER